MLKKISILLTSLCFGGIVTFHNNQNLVTMAEIISIKDIECQIRMYNGKMISLSEGKYTILVYPVGVRLGGMGYCYKTKQLTTINNQSIVEEVTYQLSPSSFIFNVKNEDLDVDINIPTTPSVIKKEFKNVIQAN